MKGVDWTIADEEGNINIPNELDKLFNRLGMQMRFHTISGKNEIQTVVDMTAIAHEHAEFRNKELNEQNDELLNALRHIAIVLENENEYYKKIGSPKNFDIDLRNINQLILRTNG